MGGTVLHEGQDSCPLGATIQVESVWNKLHILSQDSNLEEGKGQRLREAGKVWRRWGPEGSVGGIWAWRWGTPSKAAGEAKAGRRVASEGVGVGSTPEKRCVYGSCGVLLTLRSQAHVSGQRLGTPALWLALGGLNPETVLTEGGVGAGFCGDGHGGQRSWGGGSSSCQALVLDFILWKPLSLGAKKRGLVGKTVLFWVFVVAAVWFLLFKD